jgi:hypothetical protein
MSTGIAPIAEVEALNLSDIAQKTVFLSVHFGRFGNSRKADVEVKTDALQSRFSTSKRLLESEELSNVRKADSAFTTWLDSPVRCWRYGKAGMRMVPWSQFEEIYNACVKYQQVDRPVLVQKFLDVYLEQVEQAKIDLKEQAADVEFPSIDEVRSEFAFEFDILNFGTPDKLKIVSPAVYEAEKQKQVKALADASVELRDSMRFVCSEMVNKLLDAVTPSSDGKKKKIFDTTVDKLQEFLNSFDLRNVTDDAVLQAEIGKLKGIMAGVDADKLRESENLKVDLAAKLNEAKVQLASIVGNRVSRKFR